MDRRGGSNHRQPIGFDYYSVPRQQTVYGIDMNIPRPKHTQLPDTRLDQSFGYMSGQPSGSMFAPSDAYVRQGGHPTDYNIHHQQQQQQQGSHSIPGYPQPHQVVYTPGFDHVNVQPGNQASYPGSSLSPSPNAQSSATNIAKQTTVAGAHPDSFNDHLGAAIVATMFCFWPLGMLALYYSVQASNAFSRGDVAQAFISASASKSYSISSVIVFAFGIIAVGVTLVVLKTA